MNILIISYYYPPFPRVGSRRWAKFSKYLLKFGSNVFVLCNTNKTDKKGLWDNDIKQLEHESRIFRLYNERKVPYYRKKLPSFFLEKIYWQINRYLWVLINSLSKGFISDRSKKHALNFTFAAKRIIEQKNINTIIITGGPFYYCYAIGKLKIKYPKIQFILDIRDPWSHNNSGFIGSKRQKKYEALIEKKTLKMFDHITTCHSVIIDDWNKRYPELKEKISLLEHAYDTDDFEMVDFSFRQKKEPKIHKTAFIGTIYPRMEKEINKLFEIHRTSAKEGVSLEVDFYSYTKEYCASFIEQKIKVEYKQLLPPQELFKQLLKYDSILIMRPKTSDGWENFFSSKFYELLRLKIPLLYIGPKSQLSDFINKYNAGITYLTDIRNNKPLPSLTNTSLFKLENQVLNKFIQYYSFENITRKLIRIIKNEIK